jgi:hypothetical protein
VTVVVHVRGNADTPKLVRTALTVVAADVGRVAVVGGVAVTCRLRHAHRATTDVDTVADDRLPSVLEVLGELPGARSVPHQGDRVEIDGVVVDVIATAPFDDVDVEDSLDELFVRAHRFALESAEPVRLVLDAPERVEGVLPLATAAGLVATKLGGLQGRSRPAPKQATDGYDLFRLLDALDEDGAVAAAVVAGGEPLRRAVRHAAERALLRGATDVARAIRIYGADAFEEVTVDRLTFLAERFVDRLDGR